jgi:hypothetical protein
VNAETLALVISSVNPSALPLVVVVVAVVYLYFKFKKVETDRKLTKSARDADSNNIHDQLLKNTWDISRIKEDNNHRDALLDDLRQQVTIVNQNLAVVANKLDSLVEAVKEKK